MNITPWAVRCFDAGAACGHVVTVTATYERIQVPTLGHRTFSMPGGLLITVEIDGVGPCPAAFKRDSLGRWLDVGVLPTRIVRAGVRHGEVRYLAEIQVRDEDALRALLGRLTFEFERRGDLSQLVLPQLRDGRLLLPLAGAEKRWRGY